MVIGDSTLPVQLVSSLLPFHTQDYPPTPPSDKRQHSTDLLVTQLLLASGLDVPEVLCTNSPAFHRQADSPGACVDAEGRTPAQREI